MHLLETFLSPFRTTIVQTTRNLKHLQMTNVSEKNVLRRIENIFGTEENAGYQHFLLFPQCFQKAPLSNVGIVR